MYTLFRIILLILRRKPHTRMFSLNLEWQGQIIVSYSEISIPPQRAPNLLHKHAIHTKKWKVISLALKTSSLQINRLLVMHSNPLEEGKAELPHAGISDLLKQLKYPLQHSVGLHPFPYTIVMALVLKSLQQLVNQNLHSQINALQLVDLGVIVLKHEHSLTGRPHILEVVFILRECFTFYFTFSIQFCFHFSWQVSLLNLITRIASGPTMLSLPRSFSTEEVGILTPVSKILTPIIHTVRVSLQSHSYLKRHHQINTNMLAQVSVLATKWNGFFPVIKSPTKVSVKARKPLESLLYAILALQSSCSQ